MISFMLYIQFTFFFFFFKQKTAYEMRISDWSSDVCSSDLELAHRFLARQHAARIFPGDGGAGLHLRPRHLGAPALAQGALGSELVDAAPASGIARLPVLAGGVFDLRIVQPNQLHHGGVTRVPVALWCGAALQLAVI